LGIEQLGIEHLSVFGLPPVELKRRAAYLPDREVTPAELQYSTGLSVLESNDLELWRMA
jgi:hypothetical protein